MQSAVPIARPSPSRTLSPLYLSLTSLGRVLFQTTPNLTFTPTERDVSLEYRVSMATLQHPENSGQNRPRGQHAHLRVSAWLVSLRALHAIDPLSRES
jgi:hypothetical protein